MATAAPDIPVLARDLAFEQLYRQYVKDVYHYALALLRNPADAEDVTQTTFMNAYRAFKRGEEPRKPQNWLIKIAHNAARTRYARSMRRVKEVPLDDHLDGLVVPEDEKPDVAEVLEALGQLPLNQCAALVMRELEGRSYAEIADTLGVSVPAVETLIFRARRTLKVKSSAVKVLSVVQVPPSLLHLLDGGGTVVAGGGAAIGTGFLLKAAVALVAGAVATGVTGANQTPQAEAASRSEPVSAPALAPAPGSIAPARTLVLGRSAERHVVGATARKVRARLKVQRRHVLAKPFGARATTRSVGTAAVGAREASGPAASAPGTSTVGQVATTVQTVAQTLPPLPVTPPALPLPSTPSLPSAPALPPVSVPSLPVPPTLP